MDQQFNSQEEFERAQFLHQQEEHLREQALREQQQRQFVQTEPTPTEEPPAWARIILQQLAALAGGPAPAASTTGGVHPGGVRDQEEQTIPPGRPLIRPRPLLPEVEEFSGRRTDFPSWLSHINAKLATDFPYDSGKIRLYYIHGRLRGEAMRRVAPWMKLSDENPSYDDKGLLEQLRVLYEDPQAVQRATQKLNDMKQGAKTFNIYLAEFEAILWDAGGSAWEDRVKMAFLSRTLSRELQTALITIEIPVMYEEYRRKLLDVA